MVLGPLTRTVIMVALTVVSGLVTSRLLPDFGNQEKTSEFFSRIESDVLASTSFAPIRVAVNGHETSQKGLESALRAFPKVAAEYARALRKYQLADDVELDEIVRRRPWVEFAGSVKTISLHYTSRWASLLHPETQVHLGSDGWLELSVFPQKTFWSGRYEPSSGNVESAETASLQVEEAFSRFRKSLDRIARRDPRTAVDSAPRHLGAK